MSVIKSSVAGIMVVYNYPPNSVSENIRSHLKQLDRIYVVDNSDKGISSTQIKSVCNEFEECEYIGLGENKGIAEALNVGCARANEDGYTWVLTIDQDSRLSDSMLIDYLDYINQLSGHKLEKIGMLTCRMSTWVEPYENMVEDVNLCWTSGCMMNLRVFREVGGFESKLFIDGVDFDICAKIILAGYRIVRLNRIVLQHELGNTRVIRIFGKKVCYVTNHTPIRRYYMTRNNLYLSEHYGAKIKELKVTSLSKLITIAKILLFEKDKRKKINAVRLGMMDYKCQRYGKKDYL